MKTLHTILLLALLVTACVVQGGQLKFATPDQADLIRAARSLQDGFEKDAFDHFLRSARWGNKDAQKALGVLYVKGMGTEKNWAKAYAWLKLAATNSDPKIIAARDEVYAALRDDEKEEATLYTKYLTEEFGDLVALARREEWVRKRKREVTGSRTGQVGALRVQIPDATGYTWELSGTEYFQVLEEYVDTLNDLGTGTTFKEL